MSKIKNSCDVRTQGKGMFALTNYGYIRAVGYTKKACREDGIAWIGSEEELERRLKDGTLDFRRINIVDRP